jgi:lysophospholipase L1-like esterase
MPNASKLQRTIVKRGNPTPPPTATLSIDQISAGNRYIRINFTERTTGIDSIEVYRATSPTGPWTQRPGVNPGIEVYEETGLANNTTYYYQLRAISQGVTGAYTPVVNATPLNLTGGGVFDTSIGLVGDSTTALEHLIPGRNPVTPDLTRDFRYGKLLEAHYGIPVSFFAQPGARATDFLPGGSAFNAFDSQINQQFVFIQLGLNDMAAGTAPATLTTFKNNITTLINRYQARGSKVVLLTNPYVDFVGNKYNVDINITQEFYNSVFRTLYTERGKYSSSNTTGIYLCDVYNETRTYITSTETPIRTINGSSYERWDLRRRNTGTPSVANPFVLDNAEDSGKTAVWFSDLNSNPHGSSVIFDIIRNWATVNLVETPPVDPPPPPSGDVFAQKLFTRRPYTMFGGGYATRLSMPNQGIIENIGYTNQAVSRATFARARRNGCSVVRYTVLLNGAYNSTTRTWSRLSEAFLTNVVQQSLINALAEGVKVSFRCSYIVGFAADRSNEPPISVALDHVRQISAVVRNYAHAICVTDAGYFGAWGEWFNHIDSQIIAGLTTPANKRLLINELHAQLPSWMGILVRYSKDHFEQPNDGETGLYTTPITEAIAYTPGRAQVGYHDDSWLTGPMDTATLARISNGTFWPFNGIVNGVANAKVREQINFMDAVNTWQHFYVEPLPESFGGMNDNQIIEAQMRRRVSLANWYGDSYGRYRLRFTSEAKRDEAIYKMGYNFNLHAARFGNSGGRPYLELDIENHGSAGMHNQCRLSLQLGSTVIPLSSDVKKIFPRGGWGLTTRRTVRFAFNRPVAGTYAVKLLLTDPHPDLQRWQFSVPLSNNEIDFEKSGIGANDLNWNVTFS